MAEVTVHNKFVAPHFIPELGEEGLTLHEVAQSLEIEFKEAKRVLEKNLNDYAAVEISTQQEIQEVTGHCYVRKINSYALTTEDAKFFVSSYNNAIGKAYRRYLIQCEKAVDMARARLPRTPHEQAENILEVYGRIGNMLGAPKHLVQIEAAKEVKRYVGLDVAPLLQLSPAQNDIQDEDVMLEPTELAKSIAGFSTAQQINSALRAAGLQVKTKNGWEPTEQGAPLCVRHAWVKENKSGYNLKWCLEEVRQYLEDND